ncbi:transcriptional regulator, TetR family domain protein [Mycobacterium xenopi 4042]|uniref:Transcriptional regulator, TetR family domain protein n=1 Tax=Mycobacterium xenopi 4042 TaxID=1299334 RepID=X7Z5J8_MYCXE|nr:transcriptional regulator, TetR family domain protein [Mycobacterium xenopi 4042]
MCSTLAGALQRLCGSRLVAESSVWWVWTKRSLSRPNASRRSSGARPAERRRPEQKCLLKVAFVVVEQRHHETGAAAEPAKHRALAHTGGRGDVVRGDRLGAAFAD